VRRSATSTPLPVIEPTEVVDRPFWSVMVPSYNSADLLARTLESVLAQDPGPDRMQIEVVDDASSEPGVAEVVERVGGGRVGLFVQPCNVGAPANFTTCVRRSAGEWVHILHSDDLVCPGFYDRYQAQIAACPDAVLVTGPTLNVDAEEQPLNLTDEVATAGGYVTDAAVSILAANPVRFVSAVVPRRAYQAVGGFHPDLPYTNDWEMWTRLATFGPVAWVDEPLGWYRIHDTSDSRRQHATTAYLDDCLWTVDLAVDRLPADRQAEGRQAGRRSVAGFALHVGGQLAEEGAGRLAMANAARAVQIDPSGATLARASAIARRAVAVRARRRSLVSRGAG
jgi:GT2 family glycosyltransferase